MTDDNSEKTSASAWEVAEEIEDAPLPDPAENEPAEQDSSWRSVDLAAVLRAGLGRPMTELMPRTDGVCLLYRGLVHSIHGESESGKSWIVQSEAARVLKDGGRVLYIDMESDAISILERLVVALGAPEQEVIDGLVYLAPQGRPDPEDWQALLDGAYDLAVIDGVTDALGSWMRGGGATNDNDDIARWLRQFPRRLAAATGAAVVLIDHVTKSREGRGRHAVGGQQKLNGLTGAAYTVDVVEPFGRGMTGRATLWVGKDRPGAVRPHAGKADGRLQPIATFVLAGEPDGTVVASLEVPQEKASEEQVQQVRGLAVSTAIATSPERELSRAELVLMLGQRKAAVYTLVSEMLAEGALIETRKKKDRDARAQGYLSVPL